MTIQKADVTVIDLEEVSDSPLPFTQLDTTECEEKLDDQTLTDTKCDGKACLVYGVHFNQCVCLSHPVNRIDLEGLVSQCHFLDGQSYEGMLNKGKRLAYYYHYAVNVYMISGKGHRCVIPDCLKLKIRELYPNSPGVPYSDDNQQLGSSCQSKSNSKSNRTQDVVNKSKKKQKITKVKISFRNPKINITNGERHGIVRAVWKYLDLNRKKDGDIRGVNVLNTGVCIVPYVDYLLTRPDKFSGSIDVLWDIIKEMKQDKLIGEIEGKQEYRTINVPAKIV